MKCAIAKHSETLLELAIKHYRHTRETFVFISLYDDNEPYSLNEVIKVLKAKIKTLEDEVSAWPLSEALKTKLFVMRKNLIAMESRKEKLNQ